MKKRDAKRQAILDTAYRLFRAQGFDKTSVSQITAEVGGSKATIYNHFPSKDELFVECMTAAAEDYVSSLAEHSFARLDEEVSDPQLMLQAFGRGLLKLLCSAEIVDIRRLMIAEAGRADVGKLFLARIGTLRTHVEAFLSQLMASGALRAESPRLAADHLRGLLEAELIEPLLLQARDVPPDEGEIESVADRAIAVFWRAYAGSPTHVEGQVS